MGGLSNRTGQRFVPKALFIGLTVWLVAPLVIIGIAIGHASQVRFEQVRGVWVAVQEPADEVKRGGGLLLDWSLNETLYAPGWTGVVQTLLLTPGDLIESGDPVGRVGGIVRLAVHTSVPFSETLSIGDSGLEVEELNKVLAAFGYPSSSDGTYSEATTAGVARLAESIGAISDGSSFDPGWFVYLPHQTFEVQGSGMVVGAPAPTPGAAIASSDAQLTGATLVSIEAAREFASEEVPVSETEGSVAPSALSSESPEIPDAERLSLEATERVLLGTDELPVEPNGKFATEAMTRIEASIIPGVKGTFVTLTRAAVSGEWEIPSAALFSDGEGRICVVTRLPEREEISPVVVQVRGSSSGSTLVTGSLRKESEVLIAPKGDQRDCA